MSAPPRRFTSVDPPADLTCSICLESFIAPIEITSCRHIFCRRCIFEHYNPFVKSVCPECRAEITGFVDTHRLITKLAADCRVRCDDCGWTGTRDHSAHHTKCVKLTASPPPLSSGATAPAACGGDISALAHSAVAQRPLWTAMGMSLAAFHHALSEFLSFSGGRETLTLTQYYDMCLARGIRQGIVSPDLYSNAGGGEPLIAFDAFLRLFRKHLDKVAEAASPAANATSSSAAAAAAATIDIDAPPAGYTAVDVSELDASERLDIDATHVFVTNRMNLDAIPDRFLHNMIALKAVKFSPSCAAITKIGQAFLYCCPNLELVDVSPGTSPAPAAPCPLGRVSRIGAFFCSQCPRLKFLSLAGMDRVNVVEQGFLACAGVERLVLFTAAHDGCQIGDFFLMNCVALTAVDLAPLATVTSIGRGCMVECGSILSISLVPLTAVRSLGASFLKNPNKALKVTASVAQARGDGSCWRALLLDLPKQIAEVKLV